MAQKLNNSGKINRDTVEDHARSELMKQCMRKAEEIRRSLEGRQHSDSTILITKMFRVKDSSLSREF